MGQHSGTELIIERICSFSHFSGGFQRMMAPNSAEKCILHLFRPSVQSWDGLWIKIQRKGLVLADLSEKKPTCKSRGFHEEEEEGSSLKIYTRNPRGSLRQTTILHNKNSGFLTKCQTCRFNRPRAISCPIVPAYKTCRRPLAEYLLLPHDNLPSTADDMQACTDGAGYIVHHSKSKTKQPTRRH
jgi:hypothetical protein